VVVSLCATSRHSEGATAVLAVLKEIEGHKAKGTSPAMAAEKIHEAERKHLADDGDLNLTERIHKDSVSHYALRLALCKTDDQRRWLMQHETLLFRHRFENEKSNMKKQQFLNDQQIKVEVVQSSRCPDEIRLALQEMEANTFRPAGEQNASAGVYLKVPFEEVLDSVKRRRAFLHQGDAYVPYSELLTFVEPRFKMHLNKELARLSKVIHLVEQDTRLVPLLQHLRDQYLAFGDFKQEATGITGTLSLSNLEQAYKVAFPPCMLQMRERMKSHHHLKYDGRKQLGAFLKRAGLSVEDSLTFWKSSFMGSHVTPEKFDKEYAYAVRYLYGKEGNGHGFKPFSCVRMIMGEPPNERDGKVHGCPFKTMNEDQLHAMLRRLGVTGTPLRESVEAAKGEHFQIACHKSFNARYGVEDDDVVVNPNDYFDKGDRSAPLHSTPLPPRDTSRPTFDTEISAHVSDTSPCTHAAMAIAEEKTKKAASGGASATGPPRVPVQNAAAAVAAMMGAPAPAQGATAAGPAAAAAGGQ
jgi:DNA primase large subunit